MSVSLKPFNTFGIDINASDIVYIKNESEILNQINQKHFTKKHLILGGGSNVLFCKDFDGSVFFNQIKGISILDVSENYVEIKVNSGENWHQLVLHCLKNNWGGIENLSLIPGTTGAAPMQNIGAYGVEIKDVITKVNGIYISNGTLFSFTNEMCEFGYRESIFKTKLKDQIFITSIHLKLSKNNHQINMNYGDIQKVLLDKDILNPSIQDISNAVIQIRQSKLPDPEILGNAGSFFKNPIINKSIFEKLILKYPDLKFFKITEDLYKIPAAWLIEKSGFKGLKIGNTGCHISQPLVIVNYGNASGNEILNHANHVINTVQNQFDIKLQPEVNIIN